MSGIKRWNELNQIEKVTYLSKYKADCSFIVGPVNNKTKKFECYKSILSQISPVFERMFSTNFQESKCPYDIQITDIEVESFESFLKYIYYDKITCLPEQMIKLLYVAEKYMVKDLKEKCIKYLYDNLWNCDICDFINIFKYAHEFKIENILKVKKQGPTNAENWCKKLEFINWSTNIYDLKPKTFYEFIKFIGNLNNPTLSTNAFFIIDMYYKIHELSSKNIEKSTNDAEENEIDLEYLLKAAITQFIDFSKMKEVFLKNCPLKSKLLTKQEKIELSLKYLQIYKT